MKKTLLIVTGLMALAFPVHAAQITQVNQADQADQSQVSQQVKPIQTETNMVCIKRLGRIYCR
ncbi:hypothetical protein QUB19_28680 [Microcoleus sp. B4-C5]|uniref:hypothetical protein n=1 Tax=unclassified Microcoleus TaxID=2642155 RepID=UPI002FD2B7B4